MQEMKTLRSFFWCVGPILGWPVVLVLAHFATRYLYYFAKALSRNLKSTFKTSENLSFLIIIRIDFSCNAESKTQVWLHVFLTNKTYKKRSISEFSKGQDRANFETLFSYLNPIWRLLDTV